MTIKWETKAAEYVVRCDELKCETKISYGSDVFSQAEAIGRVSQDGWKVVMYGGESAKFFCPEHHNIFYDGADDPYEAIKVIDPFTLKDVGCRREEAVDHPAHYGGADDPYEAIKVIEAWQLNFHLGNAVKYIARADKKGDALEDLKKASWYLQREIERREKK